MDNLIFDIGMHDGRDTIFYLRKGFSVVGVEANPILAKKVSDDLAEYIESGRLKILNVGLSEVSGYLPFYINKEIDEWSSFKQEWASRGYATEEVMVKSITATELLSMFGAPYYAKVDIEGWDGIVVEGLISGNEKPKYISYENPMPHIFEKLVSAGYKKYKFVSQLKIGEIMLPNPPVEGDLESSKELLAEGWTFASGSSGPFGEETPGRWYSAEEMRPMVHDIEEERIEAIKKSFFSEWFDMHAALA